MGGRLARSARQRELVSLRLFRLSLVGVILMAAANTFGTSVYPWVKPHYGGAAVPVGYVTLKPQAPGELKATVEKQSLPLFDIDEKFLYLVTCSDGYRTGPGVTMLLLEFLAGEPLYKSAQTHSCLCQLTSTSTPAAAGNDTENRTSPDSRCRYEGYRHVGLIDA
jgi:hypothetical protein